MAYPLRESISLNGLDLTLFQYSQGGLRAQAADSQTSVVQLAGEPIDVSEEPVVMDTFHLGFGYSWRLLQGTYAYGLNVDARFPRLVLPGPLVTTTNLPAGITSAPRCGQDYNGHFYFGVGRYVYRVPCGRTHSARGPVVAPTESRWRTRGIRRRPPAAPVPGSSSARTPSRASP